MSEEIKADTICILCGLEEDCDCTLDDLKICGDADCLVQESGWCSCHDSNEDCD